MRQLTLASADCGNAFGAWPPPIIVATQVVRMVALYVASCDKRSMAAASGGVARMARKSAAACPV